MTAQTRRAPILPSDHPVDREPAPFTLPGWLLALLILALFVVAEVLANLVTGGAR